MYASNERIRKIIDKEMDVDDTDSKRRSALHHAVLAQSVAGIGKPIDDLDADRNLLDARRYTPLRQAVEMRYAPSIAALSERLTSIFQTDLETAHSTRPSGMEMALATVLLDQGASTKTLNNRGLRPLDITRSQPAKATLTRSETAAVAYLRT